MCLQSEFPRGAPGLAEHQEVSQSTIQQRRDRPKRSFSEGCIKELVIGARGSPRSQNQQVKLFAS